MKLIDKITIRPRLELQPFERNYNEHPPEQIADLKRSIRRFGFNKPIGVDGNGKIWTGHGVFLAAEELGLPNVPTVNLDHLTLAERKAYLIADNESARKARKNKDVLAGLLEELSGEEDINLEDTCLSLEEIKHISDLDLEPDDDYGPAAAPPGTGTGSAPAGKSKPAMVKHDPRDDAVPDGVTQACIVGDLWKLGNHRLLCGDSTGPADVIRLLDDNEVEMLLTDPPYGVDYSAKNEFLNNLDKGNRVQEPILNDAIEDYGEFFTKFLQEIPFADKNTVYIFMAGKELHNLRLAAEAVDIKWGDYLIWVKNNHVLGRKDYNAKHEFVFYGWKGTHKFYGGFNTTVIEYDKPQKNDLHPTMKPVALLGKLLNDGSLPEMNVYDPFGGSGSTLIACEKLNRVCFMMEKDPGYCSVIIERWQKFTGRPAEKIK